MLAGFSFLFEIVAYTTAFYFPIFLLIYGLKNKITYPRIGYVNHKGMGLVKRKTIFTFLILGILLFILGIFVYFKITSDSDTTVIYNTISNLAPIVFGIIVSLILLFLGKTFKIFRFYFYSIIALVSFLSMKFIKLTNILPIVLLACGSIILLEGIVTLIKFIKNYPVLEKKSYNEEV